MTNLLLHLYINTTTIKISKTKLTDKYYHKLLPHYYYYIMYCTCTLNFSDQVSEYSKWKSVLDHHNIKFVMHINSIKARNLKILTITIILVEDTDLYNSSILRALT